MKAAIASTYPRGYAIQTYVWKFWFAALFKILDKPANLLTASGQLIRLLDPQENTYDIHDIAQGLAYTCRFGGHTRGFYSVAQHCIEVSYLVPEEYALHGLLHDGVEAYIGDVPRPLKQLLPGYKAIELELEASLLQSFGLSPQVPFCVEDADRILLATEERDLMPAHPDRWALTKDVEPLAKRLHGLPPDEAKRQFLLRFHDLTSSTH